MNMFEGRNRLKDLWPELKFIWFFDKKYADISIANLEPYIENAFEKISISLPGKDPVSMNGLYNIGDKWDCDDFSALGMILVKLQAKDDFDLPIPFGRAMGNQFNNEPVWHSLNICLCKEGIYLIDFDIGFGSGVKTWQADSSRDSVFFVSV